ncbi:hypothetical protein HETIRDRAFT_410889 [Heterobasidion irregulare TC 32-1]|uniref:Uncharacterized protein n=1 Tax=Heterobasidion irregulare (strain TC 32-1) TaxID=747525 RepID=W4JZU0_HETIT|nr:uncharacterized protein HETIRDRAFT_410889 [Heterobasidion irregulare TC 32-1]ETW79088.1 hypothetical protein HETIRDRAFT_410889 [Heterobasidion irregulare TC 32-1]
MSNKDYYAGGQQQQQQYYPPQGSDPTFYAATLTDRLNFFSYCRRSTSRTGLLSSTAAAVLSGVWRSARLPAPAPTTDSLRVRLLYSYYTHDINRVRNGGIVRFPVSNLPRSSHRVVERAQRAWRVSVCVAVRKVRVEHSCLAVLCLQGYILSELCDCLF